MSHKIPPLPMSSDTNLTRKSGKSSFLSGMIVAAASAATTTDHLKSDGSICSSGVLMEWKKSRLSIRKRSRASWAAAEVVACVGCDSSLAPLSFWTVLPSLPHRAAVKVRTSGEAPAKVPLSPSVREDPTKIRPVKWRATHSRSNAER